MALLWQEDGELLIYNPFMHLLLQNVRGQRLTCPFNTPPLPQDVADFEWVMWFSTFRNHILFALTGHVIFAKIFTLLAPKVRACVGMLAV